MNKDKDPLIEKRNDAILTQLKLGADPEIVVAGGGLGLKLPDTISYPSAVRAIYSSLFTDEFVPHNRKELLSLIFVKSDPQLLKQMRELIQLTLDTLFAQLQPDQLSHELLIYHILSYLPFLAVEEGERYTIPIKVEGKWQLYEYVATKIILTPRELGSSIVAFGLDSEKGPPLLLFKGTSYPTDEGFALSLLTDINPGASVGAYAFCLGKRAISKWLNAKKAIVCGLSLGGALALRTAMKFPDHIAAVFAFNPPAPIETCHQKIPNVNVIYHENDLVPTVGFHWGIDWNIYRVYLDRKINFFQAHFKCFVARNHLILRADPKGDEKKKSRFFVASLAFILSFFLFPMALVTYLSVRPFLFKRS